MCDANGDLIGYEIDVAREKADDIGVRIQFVRTDWCFILPALIEEEFDVIVSGMGITPRRSLLVNFSVPYSEFGTAVIANIMKAAGGWRNRETSMTLACRLVRVPGPFPLKLRATTSRRHYCASSIRMRTCCRRSLPETYRRPP